MRKPWNLTTKLGAIGGLLMVLALGSIGFTLSVTWQLEGGAAAVNEAGRMRMKTWRMAQTLAAGDPARLEAQVERFEAGLRLLERGDPARPLFVPNDERSQAALAEVQRQWGVVRAAWLAPATPDPVTAARQADAFVERIDDFVDAIEARLAHWTAVLHVFQLVLMGLTIGAAVTLLYAAYLFVFNPLARLQAALGRVEGGDLAARVEVASQDEFGALGAGFNRMAGTLQELYGNLEAKVAEKTERLHAERERLAALYEASAFVERAGSLAELAQGFARQLRRVAGADAAAVRWSDETNRRYVLLGSDCLPQSLVEREQCLQAGDCLCGQAHTEASGEARTRVVAIVPQGAGVRCAAEGFEQVTTVPVRLHERVLGEVDLLYRGARPLTDDDRALLDALASHLAGAMESLRAGALEREAAVAEERALLARELHDSIAQALAFQKIQVQLLRDALARGDPAKTERTLAELEAGVRESIADVRELLVHFRTRTNAEDIVPALQTTLSKFEHQSGLPTRLEVRGEGLPLPADTQVQVLHVVQEALSNVRKHAHASTVRVTLSPAPEFAVEVCDDGCGFDATGAAPDETHVGLRIMRERAQRIGGRVEVESHPGAGTRVRLALPPPALEAATEATA